jgi:hypothetical protein
VGGSCDGRIERRSSRRMNIAFGALTRLSS